MHTPEYTVDKFITVALQEKNDNALEETAVGKGNYDHRHKVSYGILGDDEAFMEFIITSKYHPALESATIGGNMLHMGCMWIPPLRFPLCTRHTNRNVQKSIAAVSQ